MIADDDWRPLTDEEKNYTKLYKTCKKRYIHKKKSKSTIAAKGGPRSETTYRFRAFGKWKANTPELYNE